MIASIEPKKNEKYLITEKPTADTPPELQKVGRSKAGGGFHEWADVPWDDIAKKYDTGLDKTSRDFFGKDEQEIQKILDDRKELKEYLERLVANHPEKSEVKVIANLGRLKIKHNLLVDTSNIHNRFQLYLALRGNSITPSNDKGNIGRYAKSMYQISNSAKERSHEKELAGKKWKAKRWLLNTLDNHRKDAIEYLRYMEILGLSQDKDDSILLDMFEKVIENYEKLTDVIYIIDKISVEDVYMSNSIKQLILKGIIKKEKAGYIYDGIEVGANVKGIVVFLKNEENKELAIKLFEK